MSDSLVVLRNEMEGAATRLLEALADEQKYNQLNAENPRDEAVLLSWRSARRQVERRAEEYASSVEKFRQERWAELTLVEPMAQCRQFQGDPAS